MTLPISVCEACGRAAFPPPLLCPRCAGRGFREEPAAEGMLEAVAVRGDVTLGAVRLPQGPLAIARVEGRAQAGERVSLDADGGVPVARP